MTTSTAQRLPPAPALPRGAGLLPLAGGRELALQLAPCAVPRRARGATLAGAAPFAAASVLPLSAAASALLLPRPRALPLRRTRAWALRRAPPLLLPRPRALPIHGTRTSPAALRAALPALPPISALTAARALLTSDRRGARGAHHQLSRALPLRRPWLASLRESARTLGPAPPPRPTALAARLPIASGLPPSASLPLRP